MKNPFGCPSGLFSLVVRAFSYLCWEFQPSRTGQALSMVVEEERPQPLFWWPPFDEARSKIE